MKNMMIYSAKWNEKETFRMMPMTLDCPYNEVIFDLVILIVYYLHFVK